jgi:hypothetical protein
MNDRITIEGQAGAFGAYFFEWKKRSQLRRIR